jgi:hypothetical protein
LTGHRVGDRVGDAWSRLLAGDVKYRFVIDMQSLRFKPARGASA